MTSLEQTISEILLSRDFETVERHGYLIGRKKKIEVAFCILVEFDEQKLRRFLEELQDFDGRKVVATLEELPTSVQRNLGPEVYVWDREAIEHEIGRTRVESIVGEKDHGLIDELSADDYPKMVSPEELEDLEYTDLGEQIVKPVIDMSDVKQISRQTVGGFRHMLELVPYYVFDYSCALYAEGKEMGAEEGTLSVNALTSKIEEWNKSHELVHSLELNHKRLEPIIDTEEAGTLLRGEVVQRHTYERELIREDGHVTVMEKKKLSPRGEEVHLEPRGIFYLPIWCVEGVHGVMIVNAGTGKIISEDYYNP